MPTASQLVPGVVEAANFSGPSSYVQNWGTEIVGGSSSKNIPWLGAATDALLAYKWEDQQMMKRVLGEARAFLSRQASPFRGEEFSGIYTRWIVIPIDIIRQVAYLVGDMETYTEARNWLRGYTSWQILCSVRGSQFRRPAWAKYAGTMIKGVVKAAGIGGSRAWSSAKRDGSRVKNGRWHDIVWVDCEGMCSWLAAALGRKPFTQITGDNWIRDIYRGLEGLEKSLPTDIPTLLLEEEQSVLNYVNNMDAWGVLSERYLKQAISWVGSRLPQVPIDVIRTKDGVLVVWEKTFHDGSTGTLTVKQILHDDMYVYGPAVPRRSNSHKAHMTISENNGVVIPHAINDEHPDKRLIGDDRRSKVAKQHVCRPFPTDGLIYWMRAMNGGISVLRDASGGEADWDAPISDKIPPEDDGGGDWRDEIEEVVEDTVNFLVRLWRKLFG
jgi:hypothetical protein